MARSGSVAGAARPGRGGMGSGNAIGVVVSWIPCLLLMMSLWWSQCEVVMGGDVVVSRPGGAGYALLFRDHGVIMEDFVDLGEDEFTFEAWLRTSDSCHHSALFSYAAKPENPERGSTETEANHFVIYNQNNLVACHDFEYIDLYPDEQKVSCYAAYDHSPKLPSIVSRDGTWHHVAVTWTAADDGLTKIYVDGLLMVEASTRKTRPLKKGGALVLGSEQDCYSGCLDRGQGFHGEMDEVRVWKVARSQEEILRHMRDSMGLDGHNDLAAYWKFNDPEDHGINKGIRVAKDHSGRGNDLILATLPKSSVQDISSPKVSKQISDSGVLTFKNNYAMNQNFRGMPTDDLSVEFWARTPAYSEAQPDIWSEFISFAAARGASKDFVEFLDDAILVQKYSKEMAKTKQVNYMDIKTRGSISISINSNAKGMDKKNENWIDYNVGWTDGEWHHVAISWSKSTGEVTLYFDGEKKSPFMVCNGGRISVENSPGGGVHSALATGTDRSEIGSLALGARQDEGYGGNFSPQYSLRGDMSQLRFWNKVLSHQEVMDSMFVKSLPAGTKGLVQQYDFSPQNIHLDSNSITGYAKDTYKDKHSNDLYFGANSPLWVYSDAPLADGDGKPLPPPTPGEAGHALRLGDMQVLIHRNFESFPTDEMTIEFWMLSTDTCNLGVPISYATGGYQTSDNTVMIGDYNDWTISIMEDEGTISDHKSGVSSADGRWHHIAVTWSSSTGQTKLYDNGQEVWEVRRAQGQKIPSGGTLIIGREQDCQGGCFDSATGAAGDIDTSSQEYGTQDFFGLIDELRIWKRVRTGDEIRQGMRAHLRKKGDTAIARGKDIDPQDSNLVAYYNFDEGQGYKAKDVTGRGHDLYISREPVWEVVRWFAVCGNGVLEGLEECDNGDVESGKGCNRDCKIMDGWECTSTSPSSCWEKDGAAPRPPAPTPPPPPYDPPSPPSKKSDSDTGDRGGEKHSGAVLGPLLSIVVVAGIAAAAFTQRQAIYEKYPAIEDFIISLKQKLVGVRYTLIPNRGLDMEYVDTASPDFTQTTPVPGMGTYAPIPRRDVSNGD